MPFTELFTENYNRIIKPAVAEVGLQAIRSDEIYGTHAIIHDIWNSIWKARIIIADVTTKNPNVNYELGLCHAIGVTTILIANNIEDIPFDYRHRRCIIYNMDDVDWKTKLHASLKKTLEVAISDRQLIEDLPWPYDTVILKAPKQYPTFISTPIIATLVALWLNVTFLLAAHLIDKLEATVVLFIMMIALTGIVLSYAVRKP